MAELPEKFGKYHVLGIAGRGNMGVVYTAYDPFADRDVAVKICTEINTEDEKRSRVARKLFFNEAHIAQVLDHPNILKILDAGDEDGEPYIVMEYVEGSMTLQSSCDPSSLLPISKVAAVVCKIAKALDYAHRRGVIHRDVKPTNIMVTLDDDVKIGDFGIAQRVFADTTHVLGLLGSPRYMSPEQIQEENINGQTDIYSLGVVLFELLTGRTPFTSPRLSRLLHQVVNDPAPSVLDIRPDLPDGLGSIVRCALAKNPRERYRSGVEMASDLAAVFGELEHRDDILDEHDRFGAVRKLSFFKDFSDSEVWETLRAGVWESFVSGQTIVSEGNLDFSFYILVNGNVNVSRGGGVVTRFSSGDCFGEMGYVSRTKRTASIQAAKDVSLIRINEAQMEQASESCQLRFHKAFLHTLIDRLTHSSGDELAALGVEGANRPVAPNLARRAIAEPLIQAER